jgi:hypothetical protein
MANVVAAGLVTTVKAPFKMAASSTKEQYRAHQGKAPKEEVSDSERQMQATNRAAEAWMDRKEREVLKKSFQNSGNFGFTISRLTLHQKI